MSSKAAKAKKRAVAPARAELRKKTRKEPLAESLAYPGGFPVYLSRYVLFGGDKPHAALKFYNGGDLLITGLVFTLEERDADGRTLARYTVERQGLFAESGGEFSVADAPVSVGCAEISAELSAVYSGAYEYAVEGDGVSVRLGERQTERKFTFKKKPAYKVKKRGKKYVVISLLAVLAVAVAVVGMSWRLGLLNDVLPDNMKYKSTQTTTQTDAAYLFEDGGTC